MSGWEHTSFPKTNLTMYNKAKDFGFFFGLYPPTIDEDYRYEWARKIVEELTGRTLKKTSSKKKKKIPKKVKCESWYKYIGREHGKSICICCRNTPIYQSEFTAGHIISENNGGLITVDNILPICNPCNTSMATKNMDIYVKEHFPQNYDKFLKRDYKNDDNRLSQIMNTFGLGKF